MYNLKLEPNCYLGSQNRLVANIVGILAILVTTNLYGQDSANWVNGGILINDSFGLQSDRWQSSSISEGLFYIEDGVPDFGFVIGTRTMTPANLAKPDVNNDRPYADVITFDAIKTHSLSQARYDTGLSLYIIGDQTPVEEIQDFIHSVFGLDQVEIGDYRLPNQTQVAAWGEWSYDYYVEAPSLLLRPYIRAEAGPLTSAIVGFDFEYGGHDLTYLFRENATGLPIYHVNQNRRNLSVLGGADIKYVTRNDFLSTQTHGVASKPVQFRARIGLQQDFGWGSFFYGVNYLSPEFEGQDEGQFLYALGVQFR